MKRTVLIKELRKVADQIDQGLLDCILDYEAMIDGEFACSHSAKDIEAGKCRDTQPDEIGGVQIIARRYSLGEKA